MMTAQQSLNFLRAAFLDTFNRVENGNVDLGRFLRLVVDVLDPDPGYGPALCRGDGTFLPRGCGEVVVFHVYMDSDRPLGTQCPKCGAVYLWAISKPPTKCASRIVITENSKSAIGDVRSESDSGVVINDREGQVKP
jgi:hypothetical protein